MRSHRQLHYSDPHGILAVLERQIRLPHFKALKKGRESHEQKIEATSSLRNPGLAGAGQVFVALGGGGFLFDTQMKNNVRATAPVCLPTPEIPELDITAALVLSEILDPLLGKPLDQASAEAAGLHELLRHHPALRRETAALSSLVEAAELLSQFNWTTAKRFNS